MTPFGLVLLRDPSKGRPQSRESTFIVVEEGKPQGLGAAGEWEGDRVVV